MFPQVTQLYSPHNMRILYRVFSAIFAVIKVLFSPQMALELVPLTSDVPLSRGNIERKQHKLLHETRLTMLGVLDRLSEKVFEPNY